MRADEPPEAETVVEAVPEAAPARTVLIGYGRVGRHIGELLGGRGEALTVIDDRTDRAAAAEEAGAVAIVGNAAGASVLRQAGLDSASALLIANSEGDRKSPSLDSSHS